jgi:hypothetical protein
MRATRDRDIDESASWCSTAGFSGVGGFMRNQLSHTRKRQAGDSNIPFYTNAVKAQRQPPSQHWHKCWIPRTRSRLPSRRASVGEDMTQRQIPTRKGRARRCPGSTNSHLPEVAFDWGGVSQTERERRDGCKLARALESVALNRSQCDGSTRKGRRGVEAATPPTFLGRKWMTSWQRVPLLVGTVLMRRVGWTPILLRPTQYAVEHGPSWREVPACRQSREWRRAGRRQR